MHHYSENVSLLSFIILSSLSSFFVSLFLYICMSLSPCVVAVWGLLRPCPTQASPIHAKPTKGQFSLGQALCCGVLLCVSVCVVCVMCACASKHLNSKP